LGHDPSLQNLFDYLVFSSFFRFISSSPPFLKVTSVSCPPSFTEASCVTERESFPPPRSYLQSFPVAFPSPSALPDPFPSPVHSRQRVPPLPQPQAINRFSSLFFCVAIQAFSSFFLDISVKSFFCAFTDVLSRTGFFFEK